MALDFDELYRDKVTPWDMGRPQDEVARLAEQGQFSGRVLDAGCGTGENALFLAARGLEVVGVDAAPQAIEDARGKAAHRALPVAFEVADVLDLSAPSQGFDAVLDSGCFHVFNDEDRVRYVRSIRGVLRDGGRLFVLCFSERQPGTWGPRRVSQEELRDVFSDAFTIDEIRDTIFEIDPAVARHGPVPGWLAAMTARPVRG